MNNLTRRDLARLAGTSLARPAMAAAKRPNVIFLLADDVGYGDLSCHGHPDLKTPVLDRLHSESVRFTDFHSSPMCTPTRAQLMTGRNALSTRAMNVSSGRTLLRRDFPTMAEAFAASGYRTGIFGKWHLGDNYPYRPEDRGFQEAVWYPSSHIGAVPDAWNNDYFNDRYRHNGKLEQFEGYCGDVFVEQAMRWMQAQAKDAKPFFAYIPLNVAHAPLFVPPRFREPYQKLPERNARYYGMVANIDWNMGRIEEMLRSAGLRENTILVFSSDNGSTKSTAAFNAGMRGNKIELYEGGHRVPLFVRWPAGKVGGGRDCGELTHMQDIFPTMIDLCGLKTAGKPEFDGTSLGPVLRKAAGALPDRTLIVQFSRMDAPRPKKDDCTVMWKKWRLVKGSELYDLAADPGQAKNVVEGHRDIAARLQKSYDAWWATVEPSLDSFLPVYIGGKENPTLLSACEWADVFLDQGGQVRKGERKVGTWHVHAERAGSYEFALRRWPRDCDAGLAEPIPAHKAEDGEYAAGVALPIAKARLKVGGFDRTVEVKGSDREAVFQVELPAGRTLVETWFLDAGGQTITSAYYAYVTLRERPRARVIFDTDIMGDVDDVGAVAALHALARRGEVQVLAMGVSGKHPWSPACLDALNRYFGARSIPLGVNRGQGFLRDSKYAEAIAKGWPHGAALDTAMDTAPDAARLYRGILARQPDASVVLISVGQLTNISNLLKTGPDAASPLDGKELARRKVKLWVCMGGRFPSGREANIYHDPAPAAHALAEWPGQVVLSGWEIGEDVLTGGRLAALPASSPVRRAYELYNGLQPHKSWDQTAVYYGVRGGEGLWELSPPGWCVADAQGANVWKPDPSGRHRHLLRAAPPERAAETIERLMTELPDGAGGTAS